MSAADDPMLLPDDLPVPQDDGGAVHLPGLPVPAVELVATDGSTVRLDEEAGLVVVFAYPRTGRPGEVSLVPEWDSIPGARGCTPESCGFRDLHAELLAAGASLVYGLSTQDVDYQRELVERLALPYRVLSDVQLELTRALGLPVFEVAGQTLLKRLTLVIADGRIEHVFYPVFPPDRHAEEVLMWLRTRSAL